MHLKLPSSLIHMPLRHMLVVAHSSWSGGGKKQVYKGEGSLEVQLFCVGFLPMQFFPSGVSSKPALQIHWKLPSVLTQRPLRHITPFTIHSSISKESREGDQRRCWMFFKPLQVYTCDKSVLKQWLDYSNKCCNPDIPMQACLVGVPW